MSAAVVVGLCLGAGLWMVVAWGQARRPRLDERVAPHLRAREEFRGGRGAAPVTPFPTLERLLAPMLRDAMRALERWGSTTADLRVRVERAGGHLSVEQFRAEQVVWAALGLVGGVGLALVLASTRGAAPMSLLFLVAAAGTAGAAARDYALSRAMQRREKRLVAELPTVAELLALSVSAGEGALGALERVSRLSSGVMAEELRLTLAQARTGTPLPLALKRLADRVGAPAVRRFADGVATAVERGTPLADVLRAQAQDVRADGRRALMEEGGKREIAMLVPVVFLILPVTVVFAVFPGLVAIQLDF